MSIPFDETIRAVFFMAGDGMDWMGGINEADGEIYFAYRMRYYAKKNNDPWDGQDEKRWQYLKARPGTALDELISHVQGMMKTLEEAGFGAAKRASGEVATSCTLIRGSMTYEQFMAAFMELPFVHKQDA